MNTVGVKQPRSRLDPDSYKHLLRRVLARDGWRCQFCGSMKSLQVHHKQLRSHFGSDVEENLITLCDHCHWLVHHCQGIRRSTAFFTPPKPPTFATAEEERRHRTQRLAAAFRVFSSFGLDEGVAGHITARDPERLDHFWVNPFGIHFGQIRVSDLIRGSTWGRRPWPPGLGSLCA